VDLANSFAVHAVAVAVAVRVSGRQNPSGLNGQQRVQITPQFALYLELPNASLSPSIPAALLLLDLLNDQVDRMAEGLDLELDVVSRSVSIRRIFPSCWRGRRCLVLPGKTTASV
jgi:hypothetical protein